MALTIGDNFSYKGRKPLDARIVVTSITDLLAIPASTIYDGIIVYVAADKKFYTYDSNNSVDPTLQKWTELKAAGYTIKTATIDSVKTSATYQHLFLTLDDDPANPTRIDCGVAVGPKGDKGDGFAIVKLYTSINDMVTDATPVDDGKMVAVVYTDTSTSKLVAKVYVRNSAQTQDASGNENGYTYFCNIADATTIQGPKGDDGSRGYTPIATTSVVPATSTKPAGVKVTFTYGPGTYNEKIGALPKNGTFNASFTNINPSSLTITDGTDTYTSDASGNIKDGSTTIGTINYTTGLITNGNVKALVDARVHYTYKNTSDFTIYNGLTIKSAAVRSSDGHLILTMTDNSTIDAGVVGSGSGGGGTLILGCFATAPSTFNVGDIYYNTTDNKLYEATSTTAWDSGNTPAEDMIYISIADKNLYAYDTAHGFRTYGGGASLSAKLSNAIQNITGSTNPADDGLYVEDLKPLVNKISFSQQTINQDLDYCFVGFWNSTNSAVTATCTRGAAIPFNTKFEGNLEFNSTTKAIKLRAGHTYLLHYQCKQTGNTANDNHMERFYNETTAEWLKVTCNCDTSDESHTMEEIYTPQADCEVSVRNCWSSVASFNMRVNCVNTTTAGPGLRTIDSESNFIVTEVGKTVTVDPIAYMSKDGNLEETPVGNIISYMGTTVPTHYLPCDGTIYNIGQYPELENHIAKEFGTVNHFGGDGTTTWAVPDLRGEFLRGTGANSYADQGSGATVGSHQNATRMPAFYIINNMLSAYTKDGVSVTPSNADSTTLINPSNPSTYAKYTNASTKTTGTSTAANYYAYTGRPTNTSVNYCIKYETTYHVILGDQRTYKVSVPITYNFTAAANMIWPTMDVSKAQDDTSLIGTSTSAAQGQAFVAPMDGYYNATFMLPEQADVPGFPINYWANYIYKNGVVIGGGLRQDQSKNLRVPLNESFTLKLKKGDTISVGMYVSGQSAAFTRSGEATFVLVNSLSKSTLAETISQPWLWPANVEQSFGNGVYGTRFVGTYTPTTCTKTTGTVPAAQVDTTLKTGVEHTVNFGGWAEGFNSFTRFPIPTSNNVNANAVFLYCSAGGLLTLRSACWNDNTSTTPRNYDVWVLYRKK